MLTNNLKSIIIESNKLSGIRRHFIYNKYLSFLSKNKVDIFRNTFYFFKDNFKEELNFIKLNHFEKLIKLLLSYADNYNLFANKRKVPIDKVNSSQFEYDYIINYIKNELQLFDIKHINIVFKLFDIGKLYSFIKYMDENNFSLINVEADSNIFTINILVFFYDEEFDIYKIINNYDGEVIG
jgi:hypothetical protein